MCILASISPAIPPIMSKSYLNTVNLNRVKTPALFKSDFGLFLTDSLGQVWAVSCINFMARKRKPRGEPAHFPRGWSKPAPKRIQMSNDLDGNGERCTCFFVLNSTCSMRQFHFFSNRVCFFFTRRVRFVLVVQFFVVLVWTPTIFVSVVSKTFEFVQKNV